MRGADVNDAATIFDRLDREVWIVTARAGARTGGLLATFVSQASIVLELPRVLVGLAKQHHTHELIEANGAFALHLIDEDHLDWAWRFGLGSGRDLNKLQGLAKHTYTTGSPILDDATDWLDCRVEARLDTGDRTVYLGEVVEARHCSPSPPLTMSRLLQLAPADKVREMKEQQMRDSLVDAAAIMAWRLRAKTADSSAS
jgi:flavin reductase (DIM6/NTAB) family NADH-FMN oxidoreductase RutF